LTSSKGDFAMRSTTSSITKASPQTTADNDLISNPLYSIPDACRLLGGVSKWTVCQWLTKGKLQRTKVCGRTMIRLSELHKMIQDGGPATQGRAARGEPKP
jgi:hypothetical protein